MSIWTTISERIGKKDSSEDQSGFDSAITRYQQRSGPTENYIHAWYMHSILGQSLFCLNKVWRWSASGCDEVLRKAGLLSSFSVLVFYLPLVNTPQSPCGVQVQTVFWLVSKGDTLVIMAGIDICEPVPCSTGKWHCTIKLVDSISW